MKRVLTTIILAVLLCGSAMAKTELKWVDGTTLNICGHTIRNAAYPNQNGQLQRKLFSRWILALRFDCT